MIIIIYTNYISEQLTRLLIVNYMTCEPSASNISNWKYIILLSIFVELFFKGSLLLPHYFWMMGRNIYILCTYVYMYVYMQLQHIHTLFTFTVADRTTLSSRGRYIYYVSMERFLILFYFFNTAAKSLRLWSYVKRFRWTNIEVIVSETDDTIRKQDIFISVWFKMFQILDSNDNIMNDNIILYCTPTI